MNKRREFKELLDKAVTEVNILKDLQAKKPELTKVYTTLSRNLNKVQKESRNILGFFSLKVEKIPFCKKELKKIHEMYHKALVKGLLIQDKEAE